MRKRLFRIGAVIALFVGVFLPARMGGNLYPQIAQENSPVILTASEKAQLIDMFTEKAAYTYRYYRWFDGEDLGFPEKGYCRENLEVVLYWKDGIYYFMPLADCNGETKSGTEFAKVQIDLVNGQCVFHKLWQQGGLARDFGTWGLYGEARIPLNRVATYAYLGVVEIDVAGDGPPELLPLESNAYIEAAVDALRKDGNRGKLPEGRYKVYIGSFEYLEDTDHVLLTGVMERCRVFGKKQDGYKYRWFESAIVRNRDGSYDAKCGSVVGGTEKYPTTEVAAADKAEHILETKRLVVPMEVEWDETWRTDEERAESGQKDARAAEGGKKDAAEDAPQKEEIQSQITIQEAQKQMEELYVYYQWFYGDMPYEIENLLKEGETYRIYTDCEGKGDIFWLKKDGADKRSGQDCYGSICRPDIESAGAELPIYHARMGIFYGSQSQLQEIGTMTWHKPDFCKPELPPLTEDEYIRAVKEYLQGEVLPKGENSKYQLTIGRYEILLDDERAVSVAVTGAEEYYLHCLVTRYADGTYGCFAAGGSYAGEWESGRKKVERIVELDRLTIPFVEESAEEIGLYRDVLETCERVWEEPDFYWDNYDRAGWGWLAEYTIVYEYAGSWLDYRLEYAFQDLNHDGTAELLVGIRKPQTDFSPEEDMIGIICYYSRDGLSNFWVDREYLYVYKGGVIETLGGWAGCTIYHYYRLDDLLDLPARDAGICLEVREEEHFCQEKDEEMIEITQEEFAHIQQSYIGAGEEEIAWKELKGFWRR